MASAFRDYRNGMGNRCLVANAAFPGTTSVDWLPSSNPASHYQQALAQFRGVLANYTIPKSIMFSVGTNDAHLSGAPTSWASNVAATLAAFQSDLGITLPIVYTVIPVTAPDVQAPWPNWDSTRANQLTATGVGAPVQTPVGTYSDRMHFDAAACAGIVPNLSAALG
jgi:hypothetical protein